jgi:phosphopentomutase
MKRALLLVLDSVGCGNAPDAAAYGDAGADTLGHILREMPQLNIPNLSRLGLSAILQGSGEGAALWGRMRERSAGKDTTTGHWEIAGAILEEPFATFESFPPEIVEPIEREAGVTFIGNYAASGTDILVQLGAEHVVTGKLILYTSADSVIQIAAHEEVVPLERLYEICKIARRTADEFKIGRVIARPFVGSDDDWKRTSNRHDYSMLPPRTVLNALTDARVAVTGIGKISDIFAASGITKSRPTKSNQDGMRTIDELWRGAQDGLMFANLVDFDMLYGHRRDVIGYGRALEEFDLWLGGFLPQIQRDDLVIITADHGNDPTFAGTDHTREEVPVILVSEGRSGAVGTRGTFADVAATVAKYFGVAWETGQSMLGGA